jgi:hypothetical protein
MNVDEYRGCEGILYERVPQIQLTNSNILMNNSGAKLSLFVHNPEQVVRVINDVKKNTSAVMSPIQSATTKRIFVSAHTNPTDFKIVMLKGTTAADWDRFLEEARGILDIPVRVSSLQVTLDQTTVSILGAFQLEAGDKVVLRY